MVARRNPVRARAAPRPVDHFVLIIKENHSFDNYFGTFSGADGTQLPHSANPPPQDPDHRHGAWLTRHTTAVRAQFTEQDIPAYFAYARQFTLCDHYFTDVAGPSTPNHLMLITADSPIISNPPRYRLPVGAPLSSCRRCQCVWRRPSSRGPTMAVSLSILSPTSTGGETSPPLSLRRTPPQGTCPPFCGGTLPPMRANNPPLATPPPRVPG